MTILPVADGARLLGIHPKTLHHWLKEAHVPLAAHPTDARIKCVTEKYLQQVARLHGRSLQTSRRLDAASPPLVPSPVQALSAPEQEQMTQLTLALLQERERSVEHRLTALEALLQPSVGRQISALPTPRAEQESPGPRRVPRPLHPVEQLARVV